MAVFGCVDNCRRATKTEMQGWQVFDWSYICMLRWDLLSALVLCLGRSARIPMFTTSLLSGRDVPMGLPTSKAALCLRIWGPLIEYD